MIKKLTLTTIALLLSMTNTLSHATEFGTEEEARSMIARAINLVKSDKNRALDAFTNLEGGFGYKDLYVFCFDKNAILVAHPTVLGDDASELTDPDGVKIWSLVSSVKQDEIKKITYKLERFTSGSAAVHIKTSFITQVDGIHCGVGFYAE